MYGIHNNHDHIDEGERVKGDRGWEKGESGRMERGGEKMRETEDKAKRKKGGEGRKGEGERSQGIEKEEMEWEKTTPPPLIDSGTVFVFLESQMHITPLSFEN